MKKTWDVYVYNEENADPPHSKDGLFYITDAITEELAGEIFNALENGGNITRIDIRRSDIYED